MLQNVMGLIVAAGVEEHKIAEVAFVETGPVDMKVRHKGFDAIRLFHVILGHE
jgi:hypothetical protein